VNIEDDAYFENFTSQTLQEAIDCLETEDGNRNAALHLWKQVAVGNWDIETKLWCEEVAKCLLCADMKRRNDRRNAIIKAVGLYGKKEDSRITEADEIISLHFSFQNLDCEETRSDVIKRISKELEEKNLVTENENHESFIYKRLKKLKMDK